VTWCDLILVATLVTVTVAPGTTPPPVSRTTPLSVARSTCAEAAGTHKEHGDEGEHAVQHPFH
jgi:hypothetical protein